jgi:hypothetical protein
MPDKKRQKDKPEQNLKPSLLNAFFAKEKPDKDYFPDLKSQWESMDRKERVKFILGAIVGLIIFVGMLIAVYFVLVALRG